MRSKLSRQVMSIQKHFLPVEITSETTIRLCWARINNSLAMPANWYNLCDFVDKPVTEITGCVSMQYICRREPMHEIVSCVIPQ